MIDGMSVPVARVKRGIEKSDTHQVSIEMLCNVRGKNGPPIELHKPLLQPLKFTRIDCP